MDLGELAEHHRFHQTYDVGLSEAFSINSDRVAAVPWIMENCLNIIDSIKTMFLEAFSINSDRVAAAPWIMENYQNIIDSIKTMFWDYGKRFR